MRKLGILDGEEEALRFRNVARQAGDSTRRFRERVQPKYRARDDAKRSERAGDEFRKIVTRDILDDFAAAACQRAVRQGQRDADDQIAQRAKAKAQSSAVVGGKDATNRRAVRPQRIKCQALAMLCE